MADPLEPDTQPDEARSADPSMREADEPDLARVAEEWRRRTYEAEAQSERDLDAEFRGDAVPPHLRHDPVLVEEWKRQSRQAAEWRAQQAEERRQRNIEELGERGHTSGPALAFLYWLWTRPGPRLRRLAVALLGLAVTVGVVVVMVGR